MGSALMVLALTGLDSFFRHDAQMAVLLGYPLILAFLLWVLGIVAGIVAIFEKDRERWYWAGFAAMGAAAAAATFLIAYALAA